MERDRRVSGYGYRNFQPDSFSSLSRRDQIQEIVHLGRIVYTKEGFKQFLKTPLKSCGGRTARELIREGQTGAVYARLAGDYEGLGY